jgi:SRSO17 transposase
MDTHQIRRLEPELVQFLDQFGDCFGRKDTRAHLGVYVRGQLSDLPQKSVEPIALEADVAPRTLQEFLSQLKWPEDQLRDRLQRLVAAEHQGPHTIGLIDETSDPKKGGKSPGVQKQWCGRLGKTENCIVTVHLGLARDDFHCLLDSELFLPESWDDDRDRCREAGIPDDMTYRPKWEIALELYDRTVGNGVRFDWLTFDEGYGGKPAFLRELTARQQRYVGEVPRSFSGWLERPRVVTRPYHRIAAAAAARSPAWPAVADRRDVLMNCSTTRGCAISPGSGSGLRTARKGRWFGNVSTGCSRSRGPTACPARRSIWSWPATCSTRTT